MSDENEKDFVDEDITENVEIKTDIDEATEENATEKKARKKSEKTAKKNDERFPVKKGSLTVYRTEEEYSAMISDGWARV